LGIDFNKEADPGMAEVKGRQEESGWVEKAIIYFISLCRLSIIE